MTGFDRRTFLSASTVALASLLLGCSSDSDQSASDFEGRVLIVGAGAAGMTAGHLLQQRNVDFTILEAASTWGGRIKHDLDFTDFPIPLGAEWVHVNAGILDEIVNDPELSFEKPVTGYDDDAQMGFYDGDLDLGPEDVWGRDLKWIGSSWLDFYDTHIVPGIVDHIQLNTVVTTIDLTGPPIRVTDSDGTVHQADRVIMAAPLRILQRGDISFAPALPALHQRAIDAAIIWSGLKAFIEFDEAFYPSALTFTDSETSEGQRLYYDAAYGQGSNAHVLGLFSVGAQAERYQALGPDALLATMLAELDAAFDGAASRSYVRHIVQNWNDEPYAGAAYLEDDAPGWISNSLAKSVDDRLYFAGDAYTNFGDWSSVHTAARSAIDAVQGLLDR